MGSDAPGTRLAYHQVLRVSDDTLRGWLSKAGDVNEPGMWAVRWIQGAVAAGAQQANFAFSRRTVEAHLYGNFNTNSRQLAEQFVRGHIPTADCDKHWVTALDGLENFPGRIRLASRSMGEEKRQIMHIEQGSIVQTEQDRPPGASANLSLVLELTQSPPLMSTAWSAELKLVSRRLKYCPLPVMVGRKLVSQHTPYQESSALMSWMEPAIGSERFFLMQGDPRQVLSPWIDPTRGYVHTPHRCSLVLMLSRVPSGQGQARAYWLRDGAVHGPVRVAGSTGCLKMDILCPGDRPGLEFQDWYRCDPDSLFPVALVLSVARRLASGLDSMAQQAEATDRPIDGILRRARTSSPLSLALPTLGRPYNALGGGFHEALKAFSLRSNLELVTG